MKVAIHLGLLSALIAGGAFASGLPPLTSTPLDFTYDTTPSFVNYNPGSGPDVSLFNNFLILYGTPTGGGSPSKIETFNLGSADSCYGTTCPSSTPNYPSPNYVFPIGSLDFEPASIVPGTGIDSINMTLTVTGDMEPIGGAPPFYSISGAGSPTLFTGVDPGGTTGYVYFQNADGSYTNVLHVTLGMSADPILQGVLLDPPASLTFDILGFGDPGANGFLTPAVPEPASGPMGLAGMCLVAACLRWKRQRQA